MVFRRKKRVDGRKDCTCKCNSEEVTIMWIVTGRSTTPDSGTEAGPFESRVACKTPVLMETSGTREAQPISRIFLHGQLQPRFRCICR